MAKAMEAPFTKKNQGVWMDGLSGNFAYEGKSGSPTNH